MARGKRFTPTEEQRHQVQQLAGFGVPHEDIAAALEPGGVSVKTLTRHFSSELKTGRTVANAKVAGNLFRVACTPTREGVTAAIFWMKTRAGWKETTNINVGGPSGQPLFTDADVEEAREILLQPGRPLPGALAAGPAPDCLDRAAQEDTA